MLGFRHFKGTGRAAQNNLFASYPAASVIYVSAVSAYGIPVGDDTTGNGTKAAPYLTLAKAYSVAADGKVILLNGDPASPADYRHATVFSFNLAKSVTIDAVAAYGASISATTTSGATISFGNSTNQNGRTNILGKVIIDGRGLNPYGIGCSGSATSPYTIACYGTKFTGCTFYHVAGSTSSKTYACLDLRNCIIDVSLSTRTLIEHSFCGAGVTINVQGGTFANRAAQYSYGFMRIQAVEGVAPVVTVNGGSWTRVAGTTGGSITPAFNFVDSKVTLTNATISTSDPTAKSAGGDKSIVLMTSTAGAALDMGGFVIAGNTITHDHPAGGGGVWIGSDSTGTSPYTQADGKLNGGVVYGNSITGSNASASGGMHGIFNSCQANTLIYRNRVNNVGIGLVEKGGNSAIWYSNLITDCASSGMLQKGSVNPLFIHNTVVQKNYAAPCISMNTNAGVADTSGGQWIGNLLVNMTASTVTMAKVDASQIATFAYNNYAALGSGGISWNWLGAAQATLPLWVAASSEAAATSLNPLFTNAAAGDYTLDPASPVKGLVPANANAPNDYTGAPFASPASVGAYR